jgi:hypothetical protein
MRTFQELYPMRSRLSLVMITNDCTMSLLNFTFCNVKFANNMHRQIVQCNQRYNNKISLVYQIMDAQCSTK